MCDARYRLRAPRRARLPGVLRARSTRWRSIWETPSDLGVHMTAVGLMALALALILNRLVHGPFPRDDPQIILDYGYTGLHWVIWLTGSALVCVGVFRIVAIDVTRY
jgi:hypothetical protein